MSLKLDGARYGKSKVRVVKVIRGDKQHTVKELTMRVLLEGDIDRSYLTGDNSTTVPTDTIKNTCYVLAKKHSLDSIESFGVFVCEYFLNKYSWMNGVIVDITEHLWDRNNDPSTNKPHRFSFAKREGEVRSATISQKRGSAAKINSSLVNLVLLKTTESGFVGYPRDEYTTLKETKERIFCTSVNADWTFLPSVKNVSYNQVYEQVRSIIVDVFSNKYSASVQQTIYDSGEEILKRVPSLYSVHMVLPNIHIFHYDIDRFGVKNDDEIYAPQSDPSGFIEGSVVRQVSKL